MSAHCPVCGAQPQPRYKPFCSRRCADEDLMRWLKGAYVIQGSEEEDAGSENSDLQGRDPRL
jgi:hypothetical protein